MRTSMRMSWFAAAFAVAAMAACGGEGERGQVALSASGSRMIGINVLFNTAVSDAILADLGTYGNVRDVLAAIRAVTLQTEERKLDTIRGLPYVAAANPDAERQGAPVDLVSVDDFATGINTWDLDAVNVTNLGQGRTIGYDGSGVYVAVLDTGLVDLWRAIFPQERIATQYAKAFSGGGGEVGNVSEPTNQWEHDQNSHGTHVTSTIIGYQINQSLRVNGMAPNATIIPVKVLGQAGFGWSSMIAAGIVYVTNLKLGPLAGSPVVINMSLGGSTLDAVEKAAIDYAVANGVILVASAGNAGERGMGFPGAYAPVISVAASGWIREWQVSRSWWRILDVPDPTDAADFYITDFSSRQKAGQDLDVAAPGSWVVGPFLVNSGQLSFFFLGGTSMSSPHVAGIVALMAQKKPSLTAAQAESILTKSATPLPAGCRAVLEPSGALSKKCWGNDAAGAGLATADAALAATKK